MATITTLAQDLGLSVAAVSRILNGKGSFPDATRARVLARAQEVGYRSNGSALAMRSRRFGTIAVLSVTPDSTGILYPDLLDGVVEAAERRGSQVLVSRCTQESLRDIALQPGILRHRHCDGFVVNYHLPPPPAIRDPLLACGVPIVWLNLRLERACAHPDDLAAGRRLGEELIRRGHRRIAYVDFFHPTPFDGFAHYSAADRRLGLASACAAAGLALRVHVPERRLEGAEATAFARALLAGADRPDAVVAYNPPPAHHVLLAALALGLRIPADLSLAMFHSAAGIGGEPVDSVLIPFRAVATTATDLLLDAVAEPGAAIPAVAVPMGLELGRTVADRS